MAIWYKYECSYSDATIEVVAAELGGTNDDTKEIMLGGLLNVNRVDLYQQYTEDDKVESTEEAHPRYLHVVYEGRALCRLWEAYDKLEYTELMMLAQPLDFCLECHSTFYMDYDDLDEYKDSKKKPIKPKTHTDIATDHEYSSTNTSHK